MKHAPGPWAVGFQTTDDSAQIISADGQHLATVEQYPLAPNARLIAAAPELLAALQLLLPVAEAFEKQASKGAGGRRGGPVFAKARAAIAKATD